MICGIGFNICCGYCGGSDGVGVYVVRMIVIVIGVIGYYDMWL